MQHPGKAAHKTKVVRVGASMSDINVTPLVDVVLVLLIIFMVVTPLLEKDIDVRVPQTEEVETRSEVPLDQMVVGINAQGEITLNNQPIPLEQYGEQLKAILEPRPEKDRLVFFMADDQANYGRVVTVLDQTRLAGAKTLGMMTEIPPAMNPPTGVDPTGGTGGGDGATTPQQ